MSDLEEDTIEIEAEMTCSCGATITNNYQFNHHEVDLGHVVEGD